MRVCVRARGARVTLGTECTVVRAGCRGPGVFSPSRAILSILRSVGPLERLSQQNTIRAPWDNTPFWSSVTEVPAGGVRSRPSPTAAACRLCLVRPWSM